MPRLKLISKIKNEKKHKNFNLKSKKKSNNSTNNKRFNFKTLALLKHLQIIHI